MYIFSFRLYTERHVYLCSSLRKAVRKAVLWLSEDLLFLKHVLSAHYKS